MKVNSSVSSAIPDRASRRWFKFLKRPHKAHERSVTVDGTDIGKNTKEALAVRHKVGMVFQYPEYQLFEETIARGIAFGPRNFGLSETEVEDRVKEAMDFVGLDYDTYANRSPFRLSGGQMRRVAIAGVIAIHPAYLILDEPSAGLDLSGGGKYFLKSSAGIRKRALPVILVSHNMEDISQMASRPFGTLLKEASSLTATLVDFAPVR